MKILKDLHTGRKKFSRVERMHFLQELEEELKVYYLSYTETVDRPYSEQEQEIIVRIIKMLIRQLRGTSKFQLFSRRGTRRKSEDSGGCGRAGRAAKGTDRRDTFETYQPLLVQSSFQEV